MHAVEECAEQVLGGIVVDDIAAGTPPDPCPCKMDGSVTYGSHGDGKRGADGWGCADMDEWHRRRGRDRVVQVRGAKSGSGFAVGPNLVLTATHLLGGERWVNVYVPAYDRELRGVSVATVGDLALVQVAARGESVWPALESLSVRFGRPDGDRPVPCLAMGYPRFQQRELGRGLEVLDGQIMPGTHANLDLLALDVRSWPPAASPESLPGAGLSGAVVLTARTRHVVGVISAQAMSHGNARLDVVPIGVGLRDSTFQVLLRGTVDDVEDVRHRPEFATMDEAVRYPYRSPPLAWIDQELLVPDYGVVKFIGRDDELSMLLDWCATDGLLSVAAISGDGGSGKSRLAAELCAVVRDRWGWDSGLVSRPLPDHLDVAHPTLAVVDYVEEVEHGALVRDLIEQFHPRRRGSKLRLLLLARSPVAEYWGEMQRHLRVPVGVPFSVHLAQGLAEQAERRRHAERAVADFAEVLGRPVPELPVVAAADYANPLLIHFTCLLAVHGESVDESSGADVRNQILSTWLNREQRRWREAQPGHRIDLTGDEIHDTIAFVTLAAPSRAELERCLQGLWLFSTADNRYVQRVAAWLGQLFDAGGDPLAVRPDLLAEQLIRSTPHLARVQDAANLFRRGQEDRTSRLTAAVRTPEHLPATSAEPDPTNELRAAVRRIARTPQLLVACDYDGTVAPIVADPSKALPLPESVAALRALAGLPQTTVAVISSRALRDLATLSRLPAEVHLVGSHGTEFDIGFGERLPPQIRWVRSRIAAELERIAAAHPGVRLVVKPASVALHLAEASQHAVEDIIEMIRTGPATWEGVTLTLGRDLIELSAVATGKGTAVERLRTQTSASAALFIGDDVTDEDAFGNLHGPDIGIKIGYGETKAPFRVRTALAATQVLGLLLEIRRSWLFGERVVPIERHTMLANGNTVALLTPEAKITWLCHPTPDSSAIFADLVGGGPAGHFSVVPERERPPLGQRYRPGTMTVETSWPGLTVTDWLEDPAATSPDSADGTRRSTLVRWLTGTGRVRLEFAPRFEFGQALTQLQPIGDDGLLVLGSTEPAALYAPNIEWEVVEDDGHETARAVVDLNGSLLLELRLGTFDLDAAKASAYLRRDTAERPWVDFARSLRLPSTGREAVQRSALTLRSLVHPVTGAILAAATTSIPHELGGVRNFDRRYCWLRDAAMTAGTLLDLGVPEAAEGLLDWIARCVERTSGHPERLHPVYHLDGRELGPAAVVDGLPGYAGSRPVRVGSLANRQFQSDIFGWVADLIAKVAVIRGGRQVRWQLLEAMVEAVRRRWHEPDHGLWEARLPVRHHVYSKAMCWMAVDRALHVVRRYAGEERPEWVELRDRIGLNVLEYGWHDHAESYTVAYGDEDIDASALWIGLSGLLPADDPRFLATVLRVEADLRSGPVVHRYHWDDALPGKEGGLHLCTSWLIEAYLRTGRRTDAEQLFLQMLDTVGPTGLMSEQYDPLAERGLGNHPSAYSHVGLIRSALLLDRMV